MNVIVPESWQMYYGSTGLIRNTGIYTIPDEVLYKVADPVRDFDKQLRKLVAQMESILLSTSGTGLAAPQIGVSQRIILLKPSKKITPIINPVLTFPTDHMSETSEGCLSIPGLFARVKRRSIVKLDGFDLNGKPISTVLGGMEAIIAQHETDHLDGVLFVDRAEIATMNWSTPK